MWPFLFGFLLSIMFSRFIHVVACISTLLFYSWIIFFCVGLPHFLYPFISRWTSELFLLFGCYMYLGVHVFRRMYVFISLGHIPRSRIAGSLVTFWETARLFPNSCTIHIPTSSVWGLQILLILFYCLLLFGAVVSSAFSDNILTKKNISIPFLLESQFVSHIKEMKGD